MIHCDGAVERGGKVGNALTTCVAVISGIEELDPAGSADWEDSKIVTTSVTAVSMDSIALELEDGDTVACASVASLASVRDSGMEDNVGVGSLAVLAESV